MTSLVKVDTQRFFDKNIHVLKYNNNDYFIAREVAEALEYSDFSKVSEKIKGDWSDLLKEDIDYSYIQGKALKELKAQTPAAGVCESPFIQPNVNNIMILTGIGVNKVCIRSRTEKAVAFQIWVCELLDNMRKQSQPQVQITKDDKEARLRAKQEIAKQKLEAQVAKEKSKALINLAKDLKGRYDDRILDTLKIKACEIQTGEKLTMLLPAAPDGIWFQAEQIAKKLNTSPQMVGKIANKLGIKNTSNCQKRMQTLAGTNRTVDLFLYNDLALKQIETELRVVKKK